MSHTVTGSFASAYYGTPRSTQDIDIVIGATQAQLRGFVQSLPDGQYYADLDAALQAHKAESMFNVIDLSTGWKIDFIIRKSRPFSREEFSRRVRVDLHGVFLFWPAQKIFLLPNSYGRSWPDHNAKLKMQYQSCGHGGKLWTAA